MKTKKNLYTLTTSLLFAVVLFTSCAPTLYESTITTYQETKKKDENIKVSYILPSIKVTGKTTQAQTKGGVTISTEIIPFSANRLIKQEKNYTYSDNKKPGYDIQEISNTPYYTVTPDDIQFKIRIRNNEQVPLRLSEVGFAIIIDGTQWSFPSGYMDDWDKGLILSGFEKEYTIKGPQLEGLNNAQVVYLFINGVPTSYNEAGSITKKSNFEWYFECKAAETIQKDEQKTYTYEATPIHKERCNKCNGTGTDPKAYQCSSCKGSGTFVSSTDGKTYQCNTCKGTGKTYLTCNDCSGKGVISYPKSESQPIESMVTLTSWKVDVVTNPVGAKVSVADQNNEYTNSGNSNFNCMFYQRTTLSKKTQFKKKSDAEPIIVDYQGKTIKVLPFDQNWKKLSKVVIDFSSGTPIITKGRKVD